MCSPSVQILRLKPSKVSECHYLNPLRMEKFQKCRKGSNRKFVVGVIAGAKKAPSKNRAVHFTSHFNVLSTVLGHLVARVGGNGFISRIKFIRSSIGLCSANWTIRTTTRKKDSHAEGSYYKQQLSSFHLIHRFLSLDFDI